MVEARKFGWLLALVVACAVATMVWWTKTAWLAPAQPAEKIVLAGLSLPGAGLFFVAKERGFFREQGLEVDLQAHATGKSALDALFAGKADLAIAGDTPIVFAIVAGRDLDILSTVYRPSGGIAIIARKDRAATPSQLKGKRIGVTFVSSGQFVADTFLLVHGVAQSETTMLNMQQGEMATALLAGAIDAACMWQPHLAAMQAKLGDNGVTFGNTTLYTFRLSLVTRPGYSEQHPERARKVLAALKQAQAYIVAQPAAALGIMSQATGIAADTFKRFFASAEYDLGLEQGLLLALDDQTRWAIKRGFVQAKRIPNYLDHVRAEALTAVSPESVKIIR